MSELQSYIIENHHMVCNSNYGCPVVFNEPYAQSGILERGVLPVVLRSCRESVATLFVHTRSLMSMKLPALRPTAKNIKAEA